MNEARKTALITGIAGQDGSYLAELLVGKGYEVFGLVRNLKEDSSGYIKDLYDNKKIKLLVGDLADAKSLEKAVEESNPDEVYNLAGISDLGTAIKNPEETIKINYEAVKILLSKALEVNPKVRFCQASSREIFSKEASSPQNEDSPRGPQNPYGVAKLKADEECIALTRSEGAFACSAFFFNHESPRRGLKFVTRKITNTLAKIKFGLAECLELGNLNSKRDWGFAGDFMEGMHLMLEQDSPDDFVLATGTLHTVRDFVSQAGKAMGIHIQWEGENENEVGRNKEGKIIVRVNPDFYRPIEKIDLIGDISKAREKLHWTPKTSFDDLVKMMAETDFKEVKSMIK